MTARWQWVGIALGLGILGCGAEDQAPVDESRAVIRGSDPAHAVMARNDAKDEKTQGDSAAGASEKSPDGNRPGRSEKENVRPDSGFRPGKIPSDIPVDDPGYRAVRRFEGPRMGIPQRRRSSKKISGSERLSGGGPRPSRIFGPDRRLPSPGTEKKKPKELFDFNSRLQKKLEQRSSPPVPGWLREEIERVRGQPLDTRKRKAPPPLKPGRKPLTLAGPGFEIETFEGRRKGPLHFDWTSHLKIPYPRKPPVPKVEGLASQEGAIRSKKPLIFHSAQTALGTLPEPEPEPSFPENSSPFPRADLESVPETKVRFFPRDETHVVLHRGPQAIDLLHENENVIRDKLRQW